MTLTFSASIDRKHADRSLLGVGSSLSLWTSTATVIALAFSFGGGTRQGLWSDAVVQIAAIALLMYLLARKGERPLTLGNGLAPVIVLAALLLPLLQLIPLPPGWWTSLSGRASIAAAYGDAGILLPWLPISVDPAATWRSLLSLLPPLAVYLATLQMGFRARRSLTLLILAIGVVSVVVGAAQQVAGIDGYLRFFSASSDAATGFFANHNHYAALLYCLIPFTAAWMVGLLYDRRTERLFGLAICVLIYAALFVGLGIALSRAGIFLAGAAAVFSLFLVGARQPQIARYGVFMVIGAITLGTFLVIQFSFFSLLGRFDDDILADYRISIARIAFAAARAFQPLGAGFGTFIPVYQMYDNASALLPAYVNRAHDDWLEIWLEGGAPAIAILIGFLIWLARAATQVWRNDTGGWHPLDRGLAGAASIAIVLLLLHSMLDYPLRTTALMTFIAFCCALLVPPARTRQQGKDRTKSDNQRRRPRFRIRSRGFQVSRSF